MAGSLGGASVFSSVAALNRFTLRSAFRTNGGYAGAGKRPACIAAPLQNTSLSQWPGGPVGALTAPANGGYVIT